MCNHICHKNFATYFPKRRGGGLKAVWNFSKNSSDLGPFPLQAFIVVGGENRESGMHSRVVTLFPGGSAWTYLARLPQGLWQPRLSLVSGRMTLIGGSIGGFDGGLVKSEVIINKWCKINLTNKYTFPGRYLSTILSHGTSG